jgi:hypothetical protein
MRISGKMSSCPKAYSPARTRLATPNGASLLYFTFLGYVLMDGVHVPVVARPGCGRAARYTNKLESPPLYALRRKIQTNSGIGRESVVMRVIGRGREAASGPGRKTLSPPLIAVTR